MYTFAQSSHCRGGPDVPQLEQTEQTLCYPCGPPSTPRLSAPPARAVPAAPCSAVRIQQPDQAQVEGIIS